MAKKAKASLPVTREQFKKDAGPITVVINGKEFTTRAREFSTGSLGWNLNEKLEVMVGNEPLMCQVGLNLTVIGSKDIPGFAPATAAAEEPEEKPAAAPPAPPPPSGTTPAGEAKF